MLAKLYPCGVNILQYCQTYYSYDIFNNFLSYNLDHGNFKMFPNEGTKRLPELGRKLINIFAPPTSTSTPPPEKIAASDGNQIGE